MSLWLTCFQFHFRVKLVAWVQKKFIMTVVTKAHRLSQILISLLVLLLSYLSLSSNCKIWLLQLCFNIYIHVYIHILFLNIQIFLYMKSQLELFFFFILAVSLFCIIGLLKNKGSKAYPNLLGSSKIQCRFIEHLYSF